MRAWFVSINTKLSPSNIIHAVGACVVDEKPVVINDAYADDRFSQDVSSNLMC